MEAWNLLERTHEPSMVLPVCPTPLTSLAFPAPAQPQGTATAAAASHLLAAGTCHLMQDQQLAVCAVHVAVCLPHASHLPGLYCPCTATSGPDAAISLQQA